jgi:hypothetical protein
MKKTGMRLTVYLPDELGQAAKASGMNLSRTFREAVERHLYGDAGTNVEVQRAGRVVDVTVSVPVETLRALTDAENA